MIGFIIRLLLIAVPIAVFAASFKINQQYERSVVLRLGKLNRTTKEGWFFIIPFIETIERIDFRVRTDTFNVKETLTKDNVPVDVSAVVFWKVVDAKKAMLDVQEYYVAIENLAQTTLRDLIGRTDLSTMLSNKTSINKQIKEALDKDAESWGIEVSAVEMNEVKIPAALQEAMSRQAQAEREKMARITIADSEIEASKRMVRAADTYDKNKTALQLRWMNQVYEIGLHGNGATILIPADMPIAGLGGTIGTAIATMPKKKGGE